MKTVYALRGSDRSVVNSTHEKRPNAKIPQCIKQMSQNATFCNIKGHISVAKLCIVGYFYMFKIPAVFGFLLKQFVIWSLVCYWNAQSTTAGHHHLCWQNDDNTKSIMLTKMAYRCLKTIYGLDFNLTIWDPFYQHGYTLILSWISNCTHHKMWEGITCTFSNLELDK